MFRFAASYSRRALLAAAVAIVAAVSVPALAAPAEPLVTPQWLNEHRSESGPGGARHPLGDRWRRGRGLSQGAHPRRRAQRLRQGRLARDAQRRAVHAADRGRAREADRRDRHRRGQPRRDRAGGRQRHRLRLGRARLLDAEGRGPSGGVDPRRRLCRLAGGVLSGRDRQEPRRRRRSSPRRSTIRCWPRSTRWSAFATAARRCSMRGPRASSPAGRRRRRRRPTATFPARINLDSATFYDPATNRLRSKAELAAIASELPAGPVVSYCNTGHWAATNWFVLSEMLGRHGRAALRRLDGRVDRRCAPPGRLVAHPLGRCEEGARLRLLSRRVRPI